LFAFQRIGACEARQWHAQRIGLTIAVVLGVDGDRPFGAPTNLAIGGSETWHTAQIR
jgi:hypothetical protein